jgi:hypothetical protein
MRGYTSLFFIALIKKIFSKEGSIIVKLLDGNCLISFNQNFHLKKKLKIIFLRLSLN